MYSTIFINLDEWNKSIKIFNARMRFEKYFNIRYTHTYIEADVLMNMLNNFFIPQITSSANFHSQKICYLHIEEWTVSYLIWQTRKIHKSCLEIIIFGRCYLIIDFKKFSIDSNMSGALSRDLFVLADEISLKSYGFLRFFVE